MKHIRFQNNYRYPVGMYVEHWNKVALEFAAGIILELGVNDTNSLAIWGTGSSGAIIGAFVALALTKGGYTSEYIHVYKEEQTKRDCHHSNHSHLLSSFSYHVAVDDLVSSGTTMDALELEADKQEVTLNLFVTT